MSSPLAALFLREIRIARSVGGGGAMGVVFFLIIVSLTPFAIGPDLNLLSRIGPAIRRAIRLHLHLHMAAGIARDRMRFELLDLGGQSTRIVPRGRGTGSLQCPQPPGAVDQELHARQFLRLQS